MKFLFVDTETGGLDAEKHSLLTIAFAVYCDGKIIAEKDYIVKHKEYVVTSKALEINKIDIVHHDLVAVEPNNVIQDIKMFLLTNFGTDKPVIAGHNVEFDNGFLVKLFKDEDEVWNNYVSHRKIDTCSLINYLIATGRINLESASLEASIKHFDIKIDTRHTAKDDVRATISLFEKINKNLGGIL